MTTEDLIKEARELCDNQAKNWIAYPAEFIARSRTLIPELVEALDESQATISQLYLKTLEPEERHDELVADLKMAEQELEARQKRVEVLKKVAAAAASLMSEDGTREVLAHYNVLHIMADALSELAKLEGRLEHMLNGVKKL